MASPRARTEGEDIMSNDKNSLKFTWADLEQWVEKGLIAPNQARKIRKYVEAIGPVAEQAQIGPEQRKGLNLVTIAYYFGGFLILLAYTIFAGLQWDSLDYAAQSGVSLFTIGMLWTIGHFLRRAGFLQAGGLLIFAGTGIVPLLVYTLERMTGIWSEAQSYAYRDFYRDIAPVWVYMEIASILVATVILWRIRFSLLVLLIAFWSWFLSMDLTRWITQSPTWTWGYQEQLVSTLMGLAMLVLGMFLQRRTRQDYSLWFYTFGHLIVLTHLSSLMLGKGVMLGLLYLVVYLSFVVASVWLQRRVFLVFGAIGCYGYTSFLAFDVFEGSSSFVLALGSIGLLVILTTAGYQKHVRPWLERRLKSYRGFVS
jgi:hypothetical protein